MRRGLVVLVLVLVAVAGVSSYGTAYGRWPATTTTLPYVVNPANQDGLAAAAILADLAAAVAQWDASSSASVPRWTYAGAHSRTAATKAEGPVYNGKYEMLFSTATDGSGLAQTFIWHNTGGPILEIDMVLYDTKKWYTGDTGCTSGWYVKQTTTHEWGHAYGLGHSTVTDATMYPSAAACTLANFSLAADDLAAIELLYPPTTTKPPTPASNLRVS